LKGPRTRRQGPRNFIGGPLAARVAPKSEWRCSSPVEWDAEIFENCWSNEELDALLSAVCTGQSGNKASAYVNSGGPRIRTEESDDAF
jgi:hypothetical protein